MDINESQVMIIDKMGTDFLRGDIHDFNSSHLDFLSEFIYENYNSEPNLFSGFHGDVTDKLARFLKEKGNIVYLHTIGYGLLYMPKYMTIVQIEKLYERFNELDKNNIYIDDYSDSETQCEMLNEINNNVEILDNYFKVQGKVKVKKYE